MFGNFPVFASLPTKPKVDPKDIPPPTPITIPRFQPFAKPDDPVGSSDALPHLLQTCGRNPAILGPLGFNAIGLNLNLDATPQQLIPDPSYIPDFQQWDALSADQVQEQNQATRKPMRNGNLSPGCQIYSERKRELSHLNEEAFRTVRRLRAPPGQQQARLGNAYEFFRCLELFTSFWDDPTQPPQLPPSPEMTSNEATTATTASEESTDTKPKAVENPGPQVTRTAAGSTMPPDYRINLLASFLKLVAYDFGCNVSPSRVEPRLHLSTPDGPGRQARKTHCPSGCHFVFQSPTTRETARAGLVYGPLAAVSARGTTDFTTPDMETAQSLDLAREIVAALITAQHRAREGKTEKRFGDGQWWATKKRWGGGSGGPIGREAAKETKNGKASDSKPTDGDDLPMPITKRPRKTMSIYDSYRMVRPPASTWDKKAQYEAIGKQKGADYDDVFVVSSLFHHISLVRVRVPTRLLEVLAGEQEEPDWSKRSWGVVEAWRSPWYDLFDIGERLQALQLLWDMLAYQMRKDTGGEDEDVKMTNT